MKTELNKTQNYDQQKMLEIVKRYFRREYNYAAEEIEAGSLLGDCECGCIESDGRQPAILREDKLREPAITAFFETAFKGSKKNGFRDMLFLMNDVSILGQTRKNEAEDTVLSQAGDDTKLFQFAKDCYGTVRTFNIGRKIARAYLEGSGRIYTKAQSGLRELDTDAVAYDIVLKIIAENKENNAGLNAYTYLAPLMYIDFYDLVFYTDRLLHNSMIYKKTHPIAKELKNRLLGITNQPEYSLDKADGSRLYSGFMRAYDAYKVQLLFRTEEAC